MNKKIVKEMTEVVEEFTIEFLKEVYKEFGYTHIDVMNNEGGSYSALSEGAELILTLTYGKELTMNFNNLCYH